MENGADLEQQLAEAQRQLHEVKRLLWLWANSKTYDEGCKHWGRLCEALGYDVARDRKVERRS